MQEKIESECKKGNHDFIEKVNTIWESGVPYPEYTDEFVCINCGIKSNTMKLLPSTKLQLEIGSQIDLFDLSFTPDPFKGTTIEEVKEDPTGEYGLEGDTIVLARFKDLHTDEMCIMIFKLILGIY